MRPDWNEYFMSIAKIISTRSTCNSRPTGAVIVREKQILATGYNGSMPGAPHCTDQVDEAGKPFCFRRFAKVPEHDKYNYCRSSHAEANAIAQAARLGISLEGSTLYVTLAPCYVCLKLLATARVKHIYYEYEYESVDRDRDEFWKNAIKESRVETFRRLQISHETIRTIEKAMEYPTSARRLIENLECKAGTMGGNGNGMDVSDLYPIYKEALLDALIGTLTGDRMIGKSLEMSIKGSSDITLEDSRYRSALGLLKSLSIIDGNILSSSRLISELFLKITQATGGSVSGDPFLIKALVEKGTLNMVLNVHDADLINHFPALIDATSLLYEDLYMNLLDHVDLSLKEGEAKAIVDKPYIKLDATQKAKEILTKS